VRKPPVDIQVLKKVINDNRGLTLKHLGKMLGGYAESTISKIIKKNNISYDVKNSQSMIASDYQIKNKSLHKSMKNCPKCNHDLGRVLYDLRIDGFLRCHDIVQKHTQESTTMCDSCLTLLEIKTVTSIKTETTISVKEDL